MLSGGGARGAAHVGVIKVLEEYRVPIHCIAGTSMGALVGGAYAIGHDASPEMEAINAGITTELLFKEKPPRQELSMRRKQDDYTTFVGPEIGFAAATLPLPKGVVTGVQLETVLRELSRVKGYHHFDELPIPYPRRGHRPGDRQGRGLQRGRTGQRDARQHVGAGRGGAGGVRRHDAGRRHAHQQPAGGGGARDGRRHRHRGQRRHAAAQARGS